MRLLRKRQPQPAQPQKAEPSGDLWSTAGVAPAAKKIVFVRVAKQYVVGPHKHQVATLINAQTRERIPEGASSPALVILGPDGKPERIQIGEREGKPVMCSVFALHSLMECGTQVIPYVVPHQTRSHADALAWTTRYAVRDLDSLRLVVQ